MATNTLIREQKPTNTSSTIKGSAAQARSSIALTLPAAPAFQSSELPVSFAQPQRDASTGRWLIDVPLSTFSEHSAWLSSGNWQGRFDCALWLRTPAGLDHPLQLVLKFTDNGGEKAITIDRCQPGNHRTVLLNGMITLNVNGRIREAGLYLMGRSKAVISLEEWHITAQQKRTR